MTLRPTHANMQTEYALANNVKTVLYSPLGMELAIRRASRWYRFTDTPWLGNVTVILSPVTLTAA